MLTDAQIQKFMDLHEKCFGVAISRKDAYDKAAKLVRLFQIIYKPITQKDYERLQERRKQTGD